MLFIFQWQKHLMPVAKTMLEIIKSLHRNQKGRFSELFLSCAKICFLLAFNMMATLFVLTDNTLQRGEIESILKKFETIANFQVIVK